MLEILGFYSIPKDTIDAIEVLYANTRSYIVTPVGETESFDILSGILQGDTLGPFLAHHCYRLHHVDLCRYYEREWSAVSA